MATGNITRLEGVWPETHERAVRDSAGVNLETKLGKVNSDISQLDQDVDECLDIEYVQTEVNVTPAQWTHGYYTGNLDSITSPTGDYWSALFDCAGVISFEISGKLGSNNYRIFDANGNEIKNGTSAYYTNAKNGTFTPPANAKYFQIVFSQSWEGSGASIVVKENVNVAKSARLDRIEAGITTPSGDLWTPTMRNGYYSAAGVATTDNNFDSCQYPVKNGYGYKVVPQVTSAANNTRLYSVVGGVFTQVQVWKTNDAFTFKCPETGDYVLQVVRDKQYSDRWPHFYEMEFAGEILPEFDKFKYSTLLFEGIVHRGYNEIAPENTLVAFALAKTMLFAKFVETDINFTSDDVPVLLHDSTINRTARNADGTAISSTINIEDITYEQALEYDFGIWKGQEYAGTKIPTLDEFLQLCKVLGLVPLIELKDGVDWTSERVAIIAASVKRVGMQKTIRFGSFSPTVLGSISAYFPNARLVLAPFSVISGGKYTQAVISQLLDDADTLASAHNNEVVLSTHYGYMSTEIYNTIAARGYNTYSWTINDSTLLANLDPNIVGVMSDNFDAARYVVDNLLNSLT